MRSLMKGVSRWLALLLFTDLVFTFLTWILRPDAILNVSVFIILFTLIVMASGFFWERRWQNRICRAAERFLETPDEANKTALLEAAGAQWSAVIDLLFCMLNAQAMQINEKTVELAAYREYIEAWVHEIKTPLSLSTLVLHNHKDEMSPYVYGRMNYVQRQLNEDVERILYYARLQMEHLDYKFSPVRLDICVQDVLAEYRTLTEENHIIICTDLQPLTVVSDQRILTFIISQLVSNAVKYADAEQPQVSAEIWQERDTVFLAVRNNGYGVPPEDAPFIFDKGFTGNHPDRQKATGMGLYLVKKYAQNLCIGIALEPVSTTGKGFGIELIFKL